LSETSKNGNLNCCNKSNDYKLITLLFFSALQAAPKIASKRDDVFGYKNQA
jgi:hypothetical protein